MAAPMVRGIAEDEFGEWFNVGHGSMLNSPLEEGSLKDLQARFDLGRCIAAVDQSAGTDKICGTATAFATELTVPGGTVAAAGVTLVGVLSTQRRRGHLSRMMRSQLADVADRGEPVAALVAAEYPIYGRFGYGPATEACVVRIDAVSLGNLGDSGWDSSPTGRVELVDNDTFAAALPGVYDRARLRSAGHLSWREHEYQAVAGLAPPLFGDEDQGTSAKAPKVLWHDDSGQVQGVAAYRLVQNWEDNRPRGKLSAFPLVVATDEAERELVRHLTAVDWIGTVRLEMRPTDAPVPLWLRDGRAATLADRSDHVWVRVLDVPAALTARRYQAPGSVVLQVDDPMGFANGRFLLEASGGAGPDASGGGEQPGSYAATCAPTDRDPDLTVPVKALGSAYLGGQSWSRLAAAGWVDEHRPGAVARAATLFSTPRAPWCAMTF